METIKPEFYIPDNEYFIGIQSMSVTYVQHIDDNAETCQLGCNELTVTAENCPGAPDDEPPYYFSIRTERWAVDTPDDLSDLLCDFVSRLKLVTNPKTEKK